MAVRAVLSNYGEEDVSAAPLSWRLVDHPMLGGLPHEGFLSPLLADIVKDDALKLPLKDVRNEDLVMVGEGGDYERNRPMDKTIRNLAVVALFIFPGLSGFPWVAGMRCGKRQAETRRL